MAKIYENPVQKGSNVLVLRGIDASFEKGQTIFIQGRSGSGKSTLLRLIAGLEVPTAGKIVYKNTDLAMFSKKEKIYYKRKTIGFLFQDPMANLFSQLTVKENILFPMRVLGELPREAQLKHVNELFHLVDLGQKRNTHVQQLSGGEKQRVAICTCLANTPALVLADEPTGELDSTNADMIINDLNLMRNTYGCTNLVVTHNEALLAKGDKIYRLIKGNLQTA